MLSLNDFDKICRICLLEKKSMLPANIPVEFQGNSTRLNEILNEIIEVETLENFPKQLCSDCTNAALNAYDFKTKAEAAYNKLLDISDNARFQCKVETIDINESELSLCEPPELTLVHTEDEDQVSDLEEDVPIKLHPCPICPLKFSAMELREHVKVHSTLSKYLNIPTELKVKRSVQFYSEGNNGAARKFIELHKCIFCNEDFTAEKLTSHACLKEFRCKECGRTFKQINHLSTHKRHHLKELTYKCKVCKKGFVLEKNYKCHLLKHGDLPLPHQCQYCPKAFANPQHLHRHLYIHTENVTYTEKYKPLTCSKCLQRFKTREAINKHVCQPVERRNGAMTTTTSAKPKVGEPLQKTLCAVCGKYISKLHIKDHMMRHNGEKQFICTHDNCDKRFVGRHQLKQHLLVHSGLKPYVCSACGKTFNNVYNLQVHERIHKGDRRHVCDICGKGFLEKSYLRKHTNVHFKLK